VFVVAFALLLATRRAFPRPQQMRTS
jgi:hypothetical protein